MLDSHGHELGFNIDRALLLAIDQKMQQGFMKKLKRLSKRSDESALLKNAGNSRLCSNRDREI